MISISRFLSRYLPIKPNEWKGVTYFFLVLFMFSLSAGFARSVGITLLIQNLGGETLPILFICIDLAVMVGSMIYAHYTYRVNSLKILRFFFIATALFSVAAQILFLLANYWPDPLRWVYGLFFVGFSFFYILIYIHMSSVIASYFTAVQTKRVTSIINTGIPLGGMLGGGILIIALNVFNIQLDLLIIVPSFAFGGALWLLQRIEAHLSLVRADDLCINHSIRRNRTPLHELMTTFKYVSRSKLMLFMSLSLMTFVIANKLLEYQYQTIIYPTVFTDPNQRATFFAIYELFANLVGLIIQLFLTSRIIVKFGVGVSNMLYPVLSTLVAFILFLYFHNLTQDQLQEGLFTMLGLGILTQFINQDMRGALRTPMYNLLFNAIPPNLWGANKAFLNGIVFPLATVIASVFLIATAESDPTNFANFYSTLPPLIALFVSILGILIAIPQWAAYNKGVFSLLNRELFDHCIDIGTLGKSNGLRQVIEAKLASSDYYHVLATLEVIRVLRLTHFADHVGQLLLKSQLFEVKKRCIETLATLSQATSSQTRKSVTYLIVALQSEQDAQVLPFILQHIAQFKTTNFNHTLEKFLQHPSAAVFVEASLCLYHHPQYLHKEALENQLLAHLNEPLSPDTVHYLRGVGELKQARHSDKIAPFLDNTQPEIRLAAFSAYIHILEGYLESHKPLLLTALQSPLREMKILALRALKECQPLNDWTPIIRLLDARDRGLVNESKELLRLNLNYCKDSLIKQVLSERISVQQQFEILSLIYSKLNLLQRNHLRKIADDALRRFIEINALLKLRETHDKTRCRVNDLVTKILQEISENYLFHVLTAITFEADENLIFFQHVSRGLISLSRANQGNALEVLSTVNEKYLSQRLIRYFEERPTWLKDFSTIYATLFGYPLPVTTTNYENYLMNLDNEMLKACLLYKQRERLGILELSPYNEIVRQFLMENGAPIRTN